MLAGAVIVFPFANTSNREIKTLPNIANIINKNKNIANFKGTQNVDDDDDGKNGDGAEDDNNGSDIKNVVNGTLGKPCCRNFSS